MKKKLSLSDLRVSSFVTEADKNGVTGGGSLVCPTNQSCYDYISCNEWQCVVHSYQDPCWRPVVTRVAGC